VHAIAHVRNRFAAPSRRRGPRRAVRWVAVGALLCGFAVASGPGAQADAGSVGNDIYTHIALSGSVYPPGATHPPISWTPPKCWLEPNNGDVYGVGSAYTPDNFALYMSQLDIQLKQAGEQALDTVVQNIYFRGIGADPIVHITNPPYNETLGNSGMWYEILCGRDSVFADYQAFKARLGAGQDGEEWFWIGNGAPSPVPVADPDVLAQYAAANTRVTPGWPTMSPNAMQTVNLATLVSNAAGANGYRRYQATATLANPFMSSTVFATPTSIVITSPDGMIAPSRVTCTFNRAGKITSACQFKFLKSTTTGWRLRASTMWQVRWNGAGGEPGWTHTLGPIVVNSPPIIVQEIQTVVGH
jgi:hypothetical protein